ncbi:type II toxin-antitoxin system RelE/ParE family toxin [Candidatus Woesearchaeota archaeon]|nr:type II toxin-antitoxin system RelE/ParE family toxin [Candidatus Woesearchaeota archaeon]
MYEVIFDPEAVEALNKLQKSEKERIFNKIMVSKENPFHFFERLTGRTDYKMRVGDYRIIADIDAGKRLIQVTVIGHRRNIYRNLD